MNCKFCGKECKNLNSLTQHEIRCKENPNRRAFNNFANYILTERKGKTKANCDAIKKQTDTMIKKYASGWVSPNTGIPRSEVQYLYENHNRNEIQKWQRYIETFKLNLPDYKVYFDGKYRVISDSNLTYEYNNTRGTSTILLEHVYFMMLVLKDTFPDHGIVHHIDNDPTNNTLLNLMVFKSNSDHVRFHVSKYAYLIYHEDTHVFTCNSKVITL